VGERAWVVARKKRDKLFLLLSIILANNVSGTFFSCRCSAKTGEEPRKKRGWKE
jgi:hypothetical protein